MVKRFLSAVLAVLMAAMMVIGGAAPAYAYTDSTVIIEEENNDTDESDGTLTPEGNMNLVDDVTEDESGLQFITVTTRDGSYYYIIIDRSGKEDNVYFLNAVDAADLLRTMSNDEKKEYEDSQKEPEKDEPVITPTDKTDDTEPEDKNPPVEKNSYEEMLPMIGMFAGIGAVIAGGYYFAVIKPKKNRGADEDREFYDDDEYEGEPEDEESED